MYTEQKTKSEKIFSDIYHTKKYLRYCENELLIESQAIESPFVDYYNTEIKNCQKALSMYKSILYSRIKL